MAEGTSALEVSVKIAGAAAVTPSDDDVVCPLLFTTRVVLVPEVTSYGTWIFN
jgi:hypothetical protein